MAINRSHLAQITARLGVLRLGTGRLGAAPKVYEMKTGALAGQIIWDRDTARDGDPAATPQTAVTFRE